MIWAGHVDRLAARRCSDELAIYSAELLGGPVSVLVDDLDALDELPVVDDGELVDEIDTFLRTHRLLWI